MIIILDMRFVIWGDSYKVKTSIVMLCEFEFDFFDEKSFRYHPTIARSSVGGSESCFAFTGL